MSIFLLVAGIISFFIATISAVTILVRSPLDIMRRWLAAFLLFAALWGVIINFQNYHYSLEYNLWIMRLAVASAVLMGFTMLKFAATVSKLSLSRSTSYILLLATGLMASVGLSSLSIPTVSIQEKVILPERTVIYYVVVAYILVLAMTSVAIVLRGYFKATNKLMKARLRLIAIGITQGIIVGVLTNIVFARIAPSIASSRFAWISLILWTAILIYAVVRHHFLDIRLAVVRTVAYFLSLVSLAAIYSGIVILLSVYFKDVLADPVFVILNMLAALVFAIILIPIKHFFDRLTNKIFYRDNYNSDDFFARLSKVISSTTDLRNLLQRSAVEVASTLNAEHGFFYVQYGNLPHKITAGTERHSHLSASDMELIDIYVNDSDGATITTSLLTEKNEFTKLLLKRNIALILPLRWRNGTNLSYLFLGPQRSREYTARDVHVLETISDELAIAIQNAVSLQDVKEINATLQERIEVATKELRESNDQLQRLDEAKDEFVSMASHQLRTPLTSVKGYISMVLEGDVGRISPSQRQLLSEAFTSSERMVHLINDFLNVSRLQTGKFMVDRREIDLGKVVGQEVDSLGTTADAHSLKIRYRQPSHFPTLYIDEGKIRQVIMNFIDNAIYYSRAGSAITVKLYVEAGEAILEVHDTGIGVPKSERAHLFTKFFRATNARKQRPDGTGVGLFLAKKVIDAHGGRVLFDSTEGEGSVFGFRLPVKKLSTAPDDDTDKLE